MPKPYTPSISGPEHPPPEEVLRWALPVDPFFKVFLLPFLSFPFSIFVLFLFLFV
jgi:hypothetical protein